MTEITTPDTSNIILVLFNLKPKRSIADYENWAKTTDLPIVRNLQSVDRFDVFRCTGLLGLNEAAPYAYAEILEINDMEVFNQDVSTELMQSVANQFQTFADSPLFITTKAIDAITEV